MGGPPLHPGVFAAVSVLAPCFVAKPEVAREHRDEVGRCLAREHTLDHVPVAGIALGFLLEDPPAGLRAEHVLLAVAHESSRVVLPGRSAAQHELTEIAE